MRGLPLANLRDCSAVFGTNRREARISLGHAGAALEPSWIGQPVDGLPPWPPSVRHFLPPAAGLELLPGLGSGAGGLLRPGSAGGAGALRG